VIQLSVGFAARSSVEKAGAGVIALVCCTAVWPDATVTVFVWPGVAKWPMNHPVRPPRKIRPRISVIMSASAV
jgi:hypothetical protein